MNSKAFDEIIQLNKDFYEKIGEDFSKTRQSPWDGWAKTLDVVRKAVNPSEKTKILDLGCGNGRLLKFLLDNKLNNFEYYGYDTDSFLLSFPIAHYDLPFVHFDKMDILKDLGNISGKFDVIFAFGLAHHIPSSEFRIKWFRQVVSILKPNGMFIFTTWNYNRDARFVPANNRFRNLKEELEDGDYFIGWNNLENVYRYVHIYSNIEIERILKSCGAKLLSKFSSDGKNGNLNDYFIVGLG